MSYRNQVRAVMAVALLTTLALFGPRQIVPVHTVHAAAQPTSTALSIQTKIELSKQLGSGAGGLYDPNDPNKGSLADYVADGWDSNGNAISWHNPTCAQPPGQSVTDHATLSDADLAKFHLDPRPLASDFGTSDAYQSAVTEWTDRVRHQLHHNCRLGMTATKSDGGPYPQELWSGWGANNNNSTVQFNGTYMYFTAPCIPGTGPVSGQEMEQMSVWSGVGGANRGNLVQSGINPYWHDDLFQGWIVVYVAFVENLGYVNHNEISLLNMTPRCGDSMFSRNGYGTGYTNGMELDDYTSGVYDTENFGPNPGTDSAECMTERIGGNLGNPLMKYNTFSMTCVHHDPYHGYDPLGAFETSGPHISPSEWWTTDSQGFTEQYPSSYGSDQKTFTAIWSATT